jgi:aminoglycoside phosphotransferase (APT) family kinase protein
MNSFKWERSVLTVIVAILDLQNFLIDPETIHLTALLDFDFSHIASPAEEFFYPFFLIHGILASTFEYEEHDALRIAQLHGFQAEVELPSTQGDSDIDWQIAKAWD